MPEGHPGILSTAKKISGIEVRPVRDLKFLQVQLLVRRLGAADNPT
jgi:hypothetical protein